MAGAILEVKFFNSFVLRKAVSQADLPMWNGSRGDGTYPQDNVDSTATNRNWAIEESRIRGGYNNTSVSLGAKAYLVEEEPNASFRNNAMIYSGIFNSRTGVNNTNQFSVADDITKAVDPANGSIQKLYAEDTNLIIFQESKVNRALIDKDAIYSAEGGGSVTASNVVIGDIIPYVGNYGISKNPESFAVYGNRKYFTDKDRNAVLRLSNDGLTEISNYGMMDFFRDSLSNIDSSSFSTGKIIGGWDIHNKQYVLSLQPSNPNLISKTLAFDEIPKGWTSFFSYIPDAMFSLKNGFYTINRGALWKHYSEINPVTGQSINRNNFYNTDHSSRITFIFNPSVSMSKNFKTVNYEGSNGWQVDEFISDFTGIGSVNTPGFIEPNTTNTKDTTPKVYSYLQGSYDNFGFQYPQPLTPPIQYAGFVRKENKYMTNLINNSSAAAGEVSFGNALSGIKGYFATVTMSTDTVTDVGGMKELFAVSSDFVESAY